MSATTEDDNVVTDPGLHQWLDAIVARRGVKSVVERSGESVQ